MSSTTPSVRSTRHRTAMKNSPPAAASAAAAAAASPPPPPPPDINNSKRIKHAECQRKYANQKSLIPILERDVADLHTKLCAIIAPNTFELNGRPERDVPPNTLSATERKKFLARSLSRYYRETYLWLMKQKSSLQEEIAKNAEVGGAMKVDTVSSSEDAWFLPSE